MTASNGNLLVIDDRAQRAQGLAEMLASHGFECQVVTDVANTTYDLGWDSDVDVILCELDLRDISWVDARHALRKMDVQVPVIMFSDVAEVEPMMNALRLGAADFFLRPVDERALVKSVERCVRQRRLRRELRDSQKRLKAANRELRGTVKMLEQDQQAGRQVQMRMLPVSPMTLGAYEFSHRMIPSLYLSGDFTDYFTLGKHHVLFFLADVSGHGSSSAFATVLLKNLFARKRSDFSRQDDDAIMSPVEMLKRANRELLDLGVDKFATMVVGVLDMQKNTLRYSVAGHLPLPVLTTGGEARYLDGEGATVGLLEEAAYHELEVELPDSFTLAVFSDGILEILPQRNLIEKEAYFLEVCGRAGGSPAVLEAELGLDDVKAAPDDIAALYVRKQA